MSSASSGPHRCASPDACARAPGRAREGPSRSAPESAPFSGCDISVFLLGRFRRGLERVGQAGHRVIIETAGLLRGRGAVGALAEGLAQRLSLGSRGDRGKRARYDLLVDVRADDGDGPAELTPGEGRGQGLDVRCRNRGVVGAHIHARADGAVRSGSGRGFTHLDERFPVAGVLAVSWLTRLLIVAARSLQRRSRAVVPRNFRDSCVNETDSSLPSLRVKM